MKQNDYLRFSYDKYLGRFGLNEFKEVAEQLEEIVNASRNPIDSRVLTCENSYTYKWSNVSILTEEKKEALKQRKEYSLVEVDGAVWDRSYKLQLTMKLLESKEPFMICLTHDKGEKNRLFFYGQSLDEQTYHTIMNRFHKRGFLYRLGDGSSKPSDLGLALAIAMLRLKA